VTLYKDMLQ